MAAMKGWAARPLLCGFLLLLLCRCTQAERGPAADALYAQATATMLDHAFPSRRIEYLLLDPRTGETIAMRWPKVSAPIPAGSLLKPFAALAYAELHAEPMAQAARFPATVCHGKKDGCWHPTGHGPVTLERALAESCNAYFLSLARNISDAGEDGREALKRVSVAYGLPAPPDFAEPGSMIGLNAEWRIPPLAIARAYAALGVGTLPGSYDAMRILAGLRMATEHHGTAFGVGSQVEGALAKTGTAPCVRDAHCVANGDGLVVVLVSAKAPHLLLLVRQRGTTGARTAEVAGRMLARIESEGSGYSH